MEHTVGSVTKPSETGSWRRYVLVGFGALAALAIASVLGVLEPVVVALAAVATVGLGVASGLAEVFAPALNITGTGGSPNFFSWLFGGGGGAPPPTDPQPPEDPCGKPLSQWKSIGEGPSGSDLAEGVATDTAIGAVDTAAKGPAGPAMVMISSAQTAAQGIVTVTCGRDPRNRTSSQRRDMDAAMKEILNR